MFDDLFTRPAAVRLYRTAPLAEDRLRYLVHCAERGAKPETLRKIAIDQLCLVRLLDLQNDDKVTRSQVDAASNAPSRPGYRLHPRPASFHNRKRFVGNTTRWLRFLGRLEETEKVRHPYADEVDVYEAWMRRERGLSEVTIRGCCEAVDRFFHWLADSHIPLDSVGITDIDRIIAAWNARRDYSRHTIKVHAERLRGFFRFAEDRGLCTPGMAEAIRPARVYLDEPVPAGLHRQDVLRLLETTEGERPVDKRDRAILMLFVAYGLRASEVSGLQLDDLDWESETLRVRRPKPGRTHLYPLSRGVGQAILRYILEVRPACPERTLFFTLRAPFRPVSRGALRNTVARRLDYLGVVTWRRGPHALRHAAAQHLLDQGMSYKVIGDYLGHRNPSSTAVYAKVNLNALREVADFNLGGLA